MALQAPDELWLRAVKALPIEYPEGLLAAMGEPALRALASEALTVKLYD